MFPSLDDAGVRSDALADLARVFFSKKRASKVPSKVVGKGKMGFNSLESWIVIFLSQNDPVFEQLDL
jgi:hypothetical protein